MESNHSATIGRSNPRLACVAISRPTKPCRATPKTTSRNRTAIQPLAAQTLALRYRDSPRLNAPRPTQPGHAESRPDQPQTTHRNRTDAKTVSRSILVLRCLAEPNLILPRLAESCHAEIFELELLVHPCLAISRPTPPGRTQPRRTKSRLIYSNATTSNRP